MSEEALSASCIILPDAAGMDRLHDLLDGIWSRLAEARDANLDRSRIDGFTLALGEVVANIARHAYRETVPEDRWIAISLSATPAGVRAELEDAGLPFEGSLDAPGDADLAEPLALLEHGRGLALIRQTVDTVAYERTEGGNRWVLEQRLAER